MAEGPAFFDHESAEHGQDRVAGAHWLRARATGLRSWAVWTVAGELPRRRAAAFTGIDSPGLAVSQQVSDRHEVAAMRLEISPGLDLEVISCLMSTPVASWSAMLERWEDVAATRTEILGRWLLNT